jgi:hypothetical protein
MGGVTHSLGCVLVKGAFFQSFARPIKGSNLSLDEANHGGIERCRNQRRGTEEKPFPFSEPPGLRFMFPRVLRAFV